VPEGAAAGSADVADVADVADLADVTDLADLADLDGSAGWADVVEARRLLAAARATLDGEGTLPPRRRTRAAAVVARAALELAVDARLARHGLVLGGATMRSRLICLGTVVDPRAGEAAAVAWVGLSSGCHQHAYELSPTWAEITHLIGLVESVVQGGEPPPVD